MTKSFTARRARAIRITGLVSIATLAACEASNALVPEMAEAVSKLIGLKFLSGGNAGAGLWIVSTWRHRRWSIHRDVRRRARLLNPDIHTKDEGGQQRAENETEARRAEAKTHR